MPKDLRSRVLTENDDYILFEKPAGLPSEPVVDNLKENALSFLKEQLGRELFLTHRLSTESAGLLVLAKSKPAQSKISAAFAAGTVKRMIVLYLAHSVSCGLFARRGCTINILRCDLLDATTSLISEGRTTWQLSAQEQPSIFRVELELSSGRPQDVRKIVAELQAPVLGDCLNSSLVKLIDAETGKPAIAMLTTRYSLS